jgi:hypothetical protein
MEERLNTNKFLHRMILVSWIALAVCFIIKLLGGNLFEIACNNENFIKVCNYADTHLWANYLISAVYCFISLFFFTLAVLQRTKYKKWELIVLILTVLIGTGVKIWNSTAGWIFDIWQMVIMPMLFLGKSFKQYLNIIIGIILLLVFQIVSLYTKNIDLTTLGDNILVDVIYSIDVLIMLVLYFGYSNTIKTNKEKSNG